MVALTVAACSGGGPKDAGTSSDDPAADVPRTADPARVPLPPTDAAGRGGLRHGGVPIEITAVLGGKQFSVSGTGECEHSADASIYERPAKLWTARFQGSERDAIRYSNLSVWQESAGAVGLTLSILVGADRHDIATVKGGETKGSGAASLADVGGGSLSVQGTTDRGAPLRLQVRCQRFTELVAEGG
jgi:hypothetical protein